MTRPRRDSAGTQSVAAGSSQEQQDGAAGRRRSPAFEIFLLGELMDGPHHGYLLRAILARMLGPYRRISWAAIYPLIRQLEQQGLIVELAAAAGQDPRAARRGRPRRYWGITGAGRQRFSLLLATPEAYTADFPETFAVKLMYLRHAAPEQRRAILAHARAYFQTQRDYLAHVFTPRSTTAILPAAEREEIFRMSSFRLASVAAQLEWIERELAQLGASDDTGSGQSPEGDVAAADHP